jgi:hypothetical protein
MLGVLLSPAMATGTGMATGEAAHQKRFTGITTGKAAA